MTRSSKHVEQRVDRHNDAALAQLLEHIHEQCEQQCKTIKAAARRESDRLVDAARVRAAALLREARKRERAAESARLRNARTQQRGRVRAVWLDLRSELARRGMASLEKELHRLWSEQENARRCWLKRALAEAALVLPGQRWQLQHPAGDVPEDLGSAISELCPDVVVEPEASEDLLAGFRVSSGNAAIDLSPPGLLARRDRIAGRLLSKQSAAPPELES